MTDSKTHNLQCGLGGFLVQKSTHPWTYPWQILEGFTASKTGLNTCEDALVVTNHFAAVFDGMTSSVATDGEETPVRIALRAVIERLGELDSGSTARAVINALSDAVRETQVGTTNTGPFGIACAVFSPYHQEIWRVGDIHVAIGDTVSMGSKLVDEAMALYRAAVSHALLAEGMSLDEIRLNDPGLVASQVLLQTQNSLANKVRAFGFGTLNGTWVPDPYVELIRIPDAVGEIILASDGYLGPAPSLEAAESYLRRALESDPACIGELKAMGKSWKDVNPAPDDRTYLRIRRMT